MRVNDLKWIKILFTKKRLMKSKRLQYLFNECFTPTSKKEIKKDLEDWGIIKKEKIKKSIEIIVASSLIEINCSSLMRLSRKLNMIKSSLLFMGITLVTSIAIFFLLRIGLHVLLVRPFPEVECQVPITDCQSLNSLIFLACSFSIALLVVDWQLNLIKFVKMIKRG